MVLLLDTTEIHSIDKNHLFFKFILFGGFLLLVLLTFPLVNAFFPEVVEGEKFEIEKRPGKFMYFFDGNIFVKWFVYLLSFIVIFGYLVLVVICAPKPEEEKMKLCQRLTKIYPYDSDDHYFLSGAYLDLGRYEDVISESQKVIEIDPKYSDAYFRWGAALSRLGKNEEAVTKFEKATDLNPLDDVSYDYWGCALIGLRKYDDAIDKIQKALTINPKDDNAYNYWGFALEYLGKKAEAIQKFQKVLDISSNPDLINAANGEIVKLKGLKLFER
jgi:tetratricopeptide (TPR) repeat protein